MELEPYRKKTVGSLSYGIQKSVEVARALTLGPDLLLLDGNPLEDFSVVGTGDKWFGADPRPASPETIRIIMKDGKIYKNTL